jgi:hypothetical protein
MPQILHCQGCSQAKGRPHVTYKDRKDPSGVVVRQRHEGKRVALSRVEFADYGPRMLCQSCRAAFARLIADRRASSWS